MPRWRASTGPLSASRRPPASRRGAPCQPSSKGPPPSEVPREYRPYLGQIRGNMWASGPRFPKAAQPLSAPAGRSGARPRARGGSAAPWQDSGANLGWPRCDGASLLKSDWNPDSASKLIVKIRGLSYISRGKQETANKLRYCGPTRSRVGDGGKPPDRSHNHFPTKSGGVRSSNKL